MLESRDLIRILKKVREKRLRILELCPKLLDKKGNIDREKVVFYDSELTEAVKEAQQYSKDTNEAVRCLRELLHY